MGQKLGSNRCPLFTMLTKQKFLNVLHSKLVKKTKGLPGLLSDPLSQGLRFSKESGLIILGDLPILKKSGPFSRVTCPHTLIMVYFQGRSAHTYSRWSIFTGDLPTHALVYFHGRPAHTYSHWSIFTSDLPTHTLVYFHGRPAHTYSHWSIVKGDLPTHTLIVVYFHGRTAHTYSLWSIFRGDLPTYSHWSIFTGDLPT
jgi:hypothetical protein